MSRMEGLRRAWANLSPEHRRAGLLAIALAVALFLPWYQRSAFVLVDGQLVVGSDSLSAFEVISFVEGAVLLVCAAVLALVYTRSRAMPFHLPGGDGTMLAVAGAWAAALLVWRLFDKPDIEGRAVTVGVAWGWFAAIVVAAALVATGLRLRAADRPEPPNPAAEPAAETPPEGGGHPEAPTPEPPPAAAERADAPTEPDVRPPAAPAGPAQPPADRTTQILPAADPPTGDRSTTEPPDEPGARPHSSP